MIFLKKTFDMTKKKAGLLIITTVVLAIAGSLFYKNHIKQQENEAFIESFQKSFLKFKENKKEIERRALQQAEKRMRDSIYNAKKKERETQLEQLKENVQKLEEAKQ